MSKKIVWNLCDLLESAGGLKRSRNMEFHEMFVIFLVTVGHNIKNRTCQIQFHRSGETVSRTIHCVLQAVLNLHEICLVKPTPVPENYEDPRWKYFQVCAIYSPRHLHYF
ncbi:hypothetical protein LINPERHAP1_LOCUS13995 [Linum perenne]